jgi:large conductance mechanosensitive channel
VKFPFSGLWQEFKSFAFKGNMIELAVAVVMGVAFGKVVTAMVDDIVMPAISYAVTAANTAKEVATNAASGVAEKTGLANTQPTTGPATVVAAAPPAPPAAAPAPPAASSASSLAGTPPPKPDQSRVVDFTWTIGRFKIGDFVGALINFMLIAFAVFIMIVKLIGSMMSKVSGGTPAPSEPTTKECPYCLSVIPLRAKKCAHCTADVPVPT